MFNIWTGLGKLEGNWAVVTPIKTCKELPTPVIVAASRAEKGYKNGKSKTWLRLESLRTLEIVLRKRKEIDLVIQSLGHASDMQQSDL